ncbi:hypothetical protein FB004_11999 [Sinorhizobium medicae]|nr:hypothetical protein FB004_11999 [Sinorhizobium medicae]
MSDLAGPRDGITRMPKLNRSDTIAISVLGLILASIVLVAWAPPPILVDREAVSGETSFNVWRDTLPQWLMAAFGIAGTVVSGLAVFLVYDTLKETRRATSR